MKKRIFCLILTASLFLSGCGFFGERIKHPVIFYYLCGSYQEDLCCVVVSEEREASGHMGDLPYLLALYLMGPTNDEYTMPLPPGTRIIVQNKDGHILLELSALPDTFSDVDFSLACACLTLTCLEISDAEDVTIRSGDRETVMSRDTLTLLDTTSETATMEEPS